MKTKRNQAFTLIELLVVITIIAILGSLAMSQFTNAQKTANQMKGVSNVKQIIIALKQFSAQNNSIYPDGMGNMQQQGGGAQGGGGVTNSNDAFRNMFIEGIVTDERIFGCPGGYNTRDNNSVGVAPAFSDAVKPGENHWALTANQTDGTVGNMPIVYENTATQSWPPQWNVDLAGQVAPGRAWAGGQIIVGRNDGSAEIVQLAQKKGMSGPRASNGMDMFTQASPQGVVLNCIPVGGAASVMAAPQAGYPGQPLPGQLPGAPLPGAPGLPGLPQAPQPGALPPSPLGNP